MTFNPDQSVVGRDDDTVFLEGEKEREVGRENEPEKAATITVWLVRHGESSSDKYNPKRGLTEFGEKQSQAAGERIADEITAAVNTGDEIELRGYDSGMDRANLTLLHAVKILTDSGFTVSLPGHAFPNDEESLKMFEREKLVNTAGPGVKGRIKNIDLTDKARKYIKRFEEAGGEGAVLTWLKEPDEKLREVGAETVTDVYDRVEAGVHATARIAENLHKKNSRRRVFVVAGTHGGVLESYLGKKLGLEVDELGEVENAEGIKVLFSGRGGAEPIVQPWGEVLEKKVDDLKK